MADPKELFAMFNDMYEKSIGTPLSTSTSIVTSNHTMTEHVGAKMDEPTRSHALDLSIVKQDDKMSDSVMSPTTSLFESEAIKYVISVQDTPVSTSAAAQFFFSAHSDHDSAMDVQSFNTGNTYSSDVISVQDTPVSTSAAAQFFFSAHFDHDSAMDVQSFNTGNTYSSVPNVEFSSKNMYSAMFVHDNGDLTVDLPYIYHCTLCFIH
ncbi:hypothetical protein C2S52_005530 [Perilla frutescens var. hirtella]|nr:hypothetical protein C2S51_010158 [Perilla frutescens var. frutescens]KAH6795053.1 hypothetical protein C2S52_005530 [Perilla frutescens var. hirtella]